MTFEWYEIAPVIASASVAITHIGGYLTHLQALYSFDVSSRQDLEYTLNIARKEREEVKNPFSRTARAIFLNYGHKLAEKQFAKDVEKSIMEAGGTTDSVYHWKKDVNNLLTDIEKSKGKPSDL